MSTGAIVAIAIGAAIILIILLALVIPRMRARKAEQQLATRREEVAGAHRDAAAEREAKARIAESEAQRARADAQLHEARADLHDRGLADDQLDRDGAALERDDAVPADGSPSVAAGDGSAEDVRAGERDRPATPQG